MNHSKVTLTTHKNILYHSILDIGYLILQMNKKIWITAIQASLKLLESLK